MFDEMSFFPAHFVCVFSLPLRGLCGDIYWKEGERAGEGHVGALTEAMFRASLGGRDRELVY